MISENVAFSSLGKTKQRLLLEIWQFIRYLYKVIISTISGSYKPSIHVTSVIISTLTDTLRDRCVIGFYVKWI